MKAAKIKLGRYCAYQERSQQEVRDKLYSLGLYKDEVEEVLTELIISGFVNEERFAIAYASGKFKLKKWGRVKIHYELKRRKISAFCIDKALNEIDEEDYIDAIKHLLSTKINSYSGTPFEVNQKAARYMINKGYESDLVWEEIHKFNPDLE